MLWCLSEPTLSEMLSDPIIAAVMAADRVAPEELIATLHKIGPTTAGESRDAAGSQIGMNAADVDFSRRS